MILLEVDGREHSYFIMEDKFYFYVSLLSSLFSHCLPMFPPVFYVFCREDVLFSVGRIFLFHHGGFFIFCQGFFIN